MTSHNKQLLFGSQGLYSVLDSHGTREAKNAISSRENGVPCTENNVPITPTASTTTQCQKQDTLSIV